MTDPRIDREVDVDPTATLTRAEGRWVLHLTRDLRHDPALVWRMLTDPARLAQWSPVVPDRPLTSTGPATSTENPGDDPVDAEVLLADEPHELVHRWGPRLLRWTLTATDEGTRLELRQTFDDRGFAASYAAGWRVCLARLAVSDDPALERVCGDRALDYGWQRLHDAYDAALS